MLNTSMIQRLLILIISMAFLNGCTRDDICPEGTPTTPLLIITFKDISNPFVSKEVDDLTIETDYDTSTTVLNKVTTDSIAIPLRASADNTRYRFILDSGDATELTDVYSFSYQRNDVYVNRACGFKTTYNSLTAVEDDEGQIDWILNLEIIKPTIEDETEAHITILH